MAKPTGKIPVAAYAKLMRSGLKKGDRDIRQGEFNELLKHPEVRRAFKSGLLDSETVLRGLQGKNPNATMRSLEQGRKLHTLLKKVAEIHADSGIGLSQAHRYSKGQFVREAQKLAAPKEEQAPQGVSAEQRARQARRARVQQRFIAATGGSPVQDRTAPDREARRTVAAKRVAEISGSPAAPDQAPNAVTPAAPHPTSAVPLVFGSHLPDEHALSDDAPPVDEPTGVATTADPVRDSSVQQVSNGADEPATDDADVPKPADDAGLPL